MQTSNWAEIDDFTRAYIECMLWSSYDESTPEGGEPMNENYSIDDIAATSMELIVNNCKAFQSANRAYFNGNYEQAGYDYWLTRNGHGTGFWDRSDDVYDKFQRDRLTEAAKSQGECYPYIGDDGKVHIR